MLVCRLLIIKTTNDAFAVGQRADDYLLVERSGITNSDI